VVVTSVVTHTSTSSSEFFLIAGLVSFCSYTPHTLAANAVKPSDKLDEEKVKFQDVKGSSVGVDGENDAFATTSIDSVVEGTEWQDNSNSERYSVTKCIRPEKLK